MRCARCNGKTKVIDSRDTPKSRNRRRECMECAERFSTLEVRMEHMKELNTFKRDVEKNAKERIMLMMQAIEL